MNIFNFSLKLSWVTLIFKAVDESEVGNYWPVSVLPSFSKLLERIMYNITANLTANEILYYKQLIFIEGHSTEHAIIQLNDQIKLTVKLTIKFN